MDNFDLEFLISFCLFFESLLYISFLSSERNVVLTIFLLFSEILGVKGHSRFVIKSTYFSLSLLVSFAS